MNGIQPYEFGALLHAIQPDALQTPLQHGQRQFAALPRTGAGIGNLALTDKTIAVTQRHLELPGPGLPGGTLHLNAVAAQRGEKHTRKIGHHIGLQVAGRVFQLVQQLGGASETVHPAARAGELGDDSPPVSKHLGQRKTERVQLRHVHITRVGNVATADLRCAFEQVAHHNALPHALPVVGQPAEMVHQRGQEQRRVGHPASNHHVGTATQRGQQGIRTQIGIGRDQAAIQAAHRFTGVQQRHVILLHPGQYVVTHHHRHAQALQPKLTRNLQHRVAGCLGVGRAHVGDDGGALLHTGRQHRAHALLQQRVVPLPWVLHTPQLRQRYRAFGQALKHQRMQAATLGQVLRGVDTVAGITGAGADAVGLFHAAPTMPLRRTRTLKTQAEINARAGNLAEIWPGAPAAGRHRLPRQLH